MKKYVLIVITLFGVLATNCKENKKLETSSETSQMDNVMATHDEVMPKMREINQLINSLRTKIDSDQGSVIDKKAMEDLQDAHKTMMDWMQGFTKNFDTEEIHDGKALTSEKQKLLDEEEKKVNIVKEKINTSIAKAEELLGVN